MTVAEVLEQVKALNREERKELMKRMVDLLDEPRSPEVEEGGHSILELAGLGAEIWKGIDAQEYVNQLRHEGDHRE